MESIQSGRTQPAQFQRALRAARTATRTLSTGETAEFRSAYPWLIRPRSRLSTLGGTRPVTSPPKLKTSFSIRELINE